MNPPLIDPAVFAELQDTAGADFVAELVDTFGEEAPPLIADLRESFAAGTADRFRRAAHSLKSNCNTFGATRLAEMARALELGGMPPDAGPIDALADEFVHTLQALKDMARG